MGWNQKAAAQMNAAAASELPAQPMQEPALWADREPIWTIVKQFNNGLHLPTFKQEVGDCVGAGAKQMGDYLSYVQIGRTFSSQHFRPWHASWIYGMSRVRFDTSDYTSDGSTGRAAALVIKNAGVYFADWKDSPKYSGELSRKWGEEPGPPASTRRLAKPHIAIQVEQIRSVENLRHALLSDKMVTIASMQGFDMAPIEKQGRHVFRPSGHWAHQMCLIEWQDIPFPAAYRMNSWGPDAHGDPLHGEPPGGAWNEAEHIDIELKSNNTECFAFSLFQAWPTEPNYNILPNQYDVHPPLPY